MSFFSQWSGGTISLNLTVMGDAMTGRSHESKKDRLRDRSDIGEVVFPIEKLMEFRDANASCVHIEAALQADRGLTDSGEKRPK